jgi:hypothetical protein
MGEVELGTGAWNPEQNQAYLTWRVNMNRMVLQSRVGADGILQLAVPIGEADADREVQVTIDPVAPPSMTQDEWRTFILKTAGSITDPSFVRHEQSQYEHREELP